MNTEGKSELLERITSPKFCLGPVSFEQVAIPDGVLLARFAGAKTQRRFVFEYRASWTRKSRLEAVERLRQTYGREFLPLLLTPYLADRNIEELIGERISMLDGCGNGLLQIPGIFILRTGVKKPKYKKVAPSRLSVYESENVATLVPRVFFSQQTFATTTAVLNACRARIMLLAEVPTPLTLSTVSKALRQLDEDLVTGSRGRERYLRDPERLLQRIERGFQIPTTPPLLLKSRLGIENLWMRLRDQRSKFRFVVTGRGSATHYTGLAGPERLQLYVNDSTFAQQVLEAKPTVAFPNIEITQTNEEALYFDSREQDGIYWSSPLQCYLEITRIGADPREQAVAERLRAKILKTMG